MEIIRYYNLKEAADLTGYAESYLRELCAKKKIAHLRRGKRYFMTGEQINALFTKIQPNTKN